MSSFRPGVTRGCRGAIVGVTPGGGSNGSACSTRRRTKSRTCSALAPCPPSNLLGARTGARSTSAHCGMRECASSVAPLAPREELCTSATTWQRPRAQHRQRWSACWRASTSSLTRLALRRLRTPCAPCSLVLRRPRSTSEPRASARCCGRPVTGAITHGSRSRFWMWPERFATTAASRLSPGLYVLGLNFLRRRRSHFIDGVGFDAAELAQDIQCHLAVSHRAVA